MTPSRDRRPAWERAVYATRPGMTNATRVLMLRLLRDMDAKGIVSVPRSKLAADLGVNPSRITERINMARAHGLLDVVRRGRPGVTAVYQGTLPGLVVVPNTEPSLGAAEGTTEVPNTEPTHGADTRPSATEDMVRMHHTQVVVPPEDDRQPPINGTQGKSANDDKDFTRFWDAYPLQVAKPSAAKAWQQALARGADPEAVITAAKLYRDDPKRKQDMTKHPHNWLNDERYNDQQPQQPTTSGSGAWWNN